MNLFEAIPANLFSIFNSKNREIYVNTLFALRQSFKQELSIEKENLIHQLANTLHQDLLNLDLEDDEELNGKKIGRDALTLARFIVKRLAETGWIEFEYGVDTSFKEYITLSPYSIKIINTLYAIALEQMYPDCKVVAIGWDMLKYVEVQGTRGPKLIERRDLSGEDYKEALVYHTFNEETKQECINYIVDTIQKIESATEYPPLDINKEYFYCSNLCGYKNQCIYFNER